MLLIPQAKPAVSFDAVGAGSPGNGSPATSCSWNHTIAGNAIVVYVALGNTTINVFGTTAVTVGGISVGSALNSVIFNGDSSELLAFGLMNPPVGVQSIAVTITGSGGSLYPSGSSTSYIGVSGFGTAVTTSTSSSQTITQTVSSQTRQMVSQAFNWGGVTLSNYNQTQRYNDSAFEFGGPLVVGDAPGASTVFFSVMGETSDPGAGIAVPLL